MFEVSNTLKLSSTLTGRTRSPSRTPPTHPPSFFGDPSTSTLVVQGLHLARVGTCRVESTWDGCRPNVGVVVEKVFGTRQGTPGTTLTD